MFIFLVDICVLYLLCGLPAAQPDASEKPQILDQKLQSGILFAKEGEFFAARDDHVVIHKIHTLELYKTSLTELAGVLNRAGTPSLPNKLSELTRTEISTMLTRINQLKLQMRSVALTAEEAPPLSPSGTTQSAPAGRRRRDAADYLVPQPRQRPLPTDPEAQDYVRSRRQSSLEFTQNVKFCSSDLASIDPELIPSGTLKTLYEAQRDSKCYAVCLTPQQYTAGLALYETLHRLSGGRSTEPTAAGPRSEDEATAWTYPKPSNPVVTPRRPPAPADTPGSRRPAASSDGIAEEAPETQSAPPTTTSSPDDWYRNPFGNDFIAYNGGEPEIGRQTSAIPDLKLKTSTGPSNIFSVLKMVEVLNSIVDKGNYFSTSSLRQAMIDNKIAEEATGRARNSTTIKRQKRALLGFMGDIMKFTFGTLSEKDGEKINEAFAALQKTQNKIVRLEKQQASVIAMTSASAHAAVDHSQKLTSAIKELAKQVDLLNVTAQATAKVTAATSEVASLLRLCQGLLSIYSVDINAFLSAWDTMLQKRLSTQFLSPTQLLYVLERVPLKPNRKFPMPLSIENMHSYYNILEVTPMRRGTDIYLYIHIPLVAPSSVYMVYRALPWPTLVNNSANIFSFYAPPQELLAISQDGLSHMVLQENQLHHCHGETIRICTPSAPVLSVPASSCAFALFHSSARDIERLCERKFVKSPPARFYGSPSGRTWAYSVPQPVRMTISTTTDLDDYTRTPSQIEISNTGFLSLPPHSVATGDGITVRSESTHYYDKNFSDMEVFVIPTFHNLPDFERQDTRDKPQPHVLSLVESILNASSPSHDLSAAFPESQLRAMLERARQLEEGDIFQVVPTSRWLTIIVVILGILASLVGLVWYFKGGSTAAACAFFLCKKCQRKQPLRYQATAEQLQPVVGQERPSSDTQIVVYRPAAAPSNRERSPNPEEPRY